MQHRLKRRAGLAFPFWDLERDNEGAVLSITENAIETTLGQYDPVEFLGKVTLMDEETEDSLLETIDRALDYQEGDESDEQVTQASAQNVVRRYLAFKYQPKETKKHKVDRLMEHLRKTTGVSKTLAKEVADAVVRGRDLPRLAVQKGWPVDEDHNLVGPQGKAPLMGLLAWL